MDIMLAPITITEEITVERVYGCSVEVVAKKIASVGYELTGRLVQAGKDDGGAICLTSSFAIVSLSMTDMTLFHGYRAEVRKVDYDTYTVKVPKGQELMAFAVSANERLPEEGEWFKHYNGLPMRAYHDFTADKHPILTTLTGTKQET